MTTAHSPVGTYPAVSHAQPTPAALVLEDGHIYQGFALGHHGSVCGELVFTTGMSGYQETLTDPSYHRQIVVSTAPQIGNTGWNDEDGESVSQDRPAADTGRIWVAGLVGRDLARQTSNFRATRSLEDELIAQKIVSIRGVDTRAIVRHIRSCGSLKAGIFSGDALTDEASMVATVTNQPAMKGAALSDEVTTSESYVVGDPDTAKFSIAAIDLGIKTNTPRMFADRGIAVHVVPSTISVEELSDLGVDGVFLSNGPGDPATADNLVQLTKEVLGQGLPLFGICFGNQILGRALGLSTYKMKFGHRGINIPVIDHETSAVTITAQNHGFALEGKAGDSWDTPFGEAHVTHTCANDGTVEGVALKDGSAFSVQYHPEAAAGPHDAAYLFDQFYSLLERTAANFGKGQR